MRNKRLLHSSFFMIKEGLDMDVAVGLLSLVATCLPGCCCSWLFRWIGLEAEDEVTINLVDALLSRACCKSLLLLLLLIGIVFRKLVEGLTLLLLDGWSIFTLCIFWGLYVNETCFKIGEDFCSWNVLIGLRLELSVFKESEGYFSY